MRTLKLSALVVVTLLLLEVFDFALSSTADVAEGDTHLGRERNAGPQRPPCGYRSCRRTRQDRKGKRKVRSFCSLTK